MPFRASSFGSFSNKSLSAGSPPLAAYFTISVVTMFLDFYDEYAKINKRKLKHTNLCEFNTPRMMAIRLRSRPVILRPESAEGFPRH